MENTPVTKVHAPRSKECWEVTARVYVRFFYVQDDRPLVNPNTTLVLLSDLCWALYIHWVGLRRGPTTNDMRWTNISTFIKIKIKMYKFIKSEALESENRGKNIKGRLLLFFYFLKAIYYIICLFLITYF